MAQNYDPNGGHDQGFALGPALHDTPYAGNPLLIGGYASNAAPTSVSAVADAVRAWFGLNGSQITSFADTAGTLITHQTVSADAGSNTRNSIPVTARGEKFNGATWDRDRKPNAITRLLSAAASTNATVVKASAGDLWKIMGHCAAAAPVFLKIYNKATAPTVGTDTPILTLRLAPGTAFSADLMGQYCSAGIGFALTVNAADSDTTAVAAGDVIALNISYA